MSFESFHTGENKIKDPFKMPENYLSRLETDVLSRVQNLPAAGTRRLYPVLLAAASLLLIVGLFWIFNTGEQEQKIVVKTEQLSEGEIQNYVGTAEISEYELLQILSDEDVNMIYTTSLANSDNQNIPNEELQEISNENFSLYPGEEFEM